MSRCQTAYEYTIQSITLNLNIINKKQLLKILSSTGGMKV